MATEDTLSTKGDIERDNEALIQEMLRDKNPVEMPSELIRNPVIHKGDTDLPAPMTVSELRSAKYYYIYSTETGDRVPCLGYMLGQKLRQRLPNGKFRFSVSKPDFEPIRGTTKCMLHPDDPNRIRYNGLGFRTCQKSNLMNPHQLRLHMQHRHKQEWETLEEERKERERGEDRQLQRLLVGQASKNIESEQPIEKSIDNTLEKTEQDKPVFLCDVCGVDFGTQKTMEKHKAEQHKK